MSLGDIASSLPWPVFACDDDKRPVVATGFKAATRDRGMIMAQFDRPGASMIGVPTGRASGLIAIDVDIKEGRDGRQWLDENRDALPETRTHRTRSGGLHLLFVVPDGVEIRNSASKVAPGIDVRGEGGYIIIPPSPGYLIADGSEPADMPLWLVRACMRPETPQPPPPSQERHERYVQAAIDDEVLTVARASEGTRNDTLNKAAVKLGTLVGAGQMSRSTAETELQRAGQAAGLTVREILATIKSGLDYGERNPRDMPPPRPNGTTNGTHRPEPPPRDEPEPDKAGPEPDPFPATPISEAELATVPPRELVYGHFLFRKFISAMGAPGGAGKTAYAFAVAAAVATGRNLLDEDVHDPGNVWIYNLEDPRTELLRRVKAVLLGHDLNFGEIANRLFLDSGRDRPLIVARADRHGNLVAWPQVSALVDELKARKIRLLIVDPFVRSHRVQENDNDQIDFVAALWASIADQADCAILLVCHFRKGGVSGESASFRGATALIDASRSAVTLASMSDDEAKGTSIAVKDRWQYVRVDNAKLNLAPPPDSAVWLRLTGVDLHNAMDGRKGDSVQTVQRWMPTPAFGDLSTQDCNDVLDEIEAGPEPGLRFTATKRGGSTRWAGQILIRKYGKSDDQAKTIIGVWMKNGLLFEREYQHPDWRRSTPGVFVNAALRPSL